jgi:hypothetical protein
MMDDDSFIEYVETEPFQFELANGNKVKIVFAQFWETPDSAGYSTYNPEDKYFAIKIYSNEDLEVNRMAVRYVLRAGYEFGITAVPTIWEWLGNLVENREHIKYDWLDEFVDDFAEQIVELTDTKEDAVEHISHLSELTDPDAFDHDVDDSIYNDHNEPDSPRNN